VGRAPLRALRRAGGAGHAALCGPRRVDLPDDCRWRLRLSDRAARPAADRRPIQSKPLEPPPARPRPSRRQSSRPEPAASPRKTAPKITQENSPTTIPEGTLRADNTDNRTTRRRQPGRQSRRQAPPQVPEEFLARFLRRCLDPNLDCCSLRLNREARQWQALGGALPTSPAARSRPFVPRGPWRRIAVRMPQLRAAAPHQKAGRAREPHRTVIVEEGDSARQALQRKAELPGVFWWTRSGSMANACRAPRGAV